MPDVRMLIDVPVETPAAGQERPQVGSAREDGLPFAPVVTPAFWRRATFGFSGFLVIVIAGANLGLPLPIFKWVLYLPGGDFTGHAILVGLLAFFAGGAFPRLIAGTLSVGAAAVALVIFGEEVSQLWLEHRSFSRLDLLGDALGLGVAEALRRIVVERWRYYGK